jgi:hypothetical protein
VASDVVGTVAAFELAGSDDVGGVAGLPPRSVNACEVGEESGEIVARRGGGVPEEQIEARPAAAAIARHKKAT